MSVNRDNAALLDVEQAARRVLRYVNGFDKAAFMEDDKTQSSVVFQLLVIGEAVKRLSFEFRIQHPEIPWSLIAGMRDNLIHEYDDIDWNEVWSTVSRDIPDLIERLQPLLPE